MAIFDFPNTPAVGDIFTDPTSGAAYSWNGYAWMGGSGGSLGALVVQDAPPTSPADNSLWYESDTGMLFLRYNDGNSSQWVQLNALPSGAGYATIPFVNSSIINSNRLINGNMRIDQRNNGAAGTATTYTADRWKYVGSAANKGTWQCLAAGAGLLSLGFGNYLSFTSSSAYTAAAGETFRFDQCIEADMVTDFAWGTTNAQPVTLSFWAYSTLTGTFSGVLKNAVPDRSYPFTYSIPVASTWTKIAVTIPGDTVGTWALTGNSTAIYLQFDLGCGSTFRGPAGSWQAGNFCGANGTVSVVSTNAAKFLITGVKLEVGTVATAFPIDSLAKQLSDCQRYYQAGAQLWGGGYGLAGASQGAVMLFPTPMRAIPTVTTGSPSYNNCSALSFAALNAFSASPYIAVTTTGGFTWSTPVGGFTLNAEL